MLNGAHLGLVWMLPFVGLLLSIAILPLVAGSFWERHFPKIAVLWGALFLFPCMLVFGSVEGATSVAHALLEDYLPFIVLLFALFAIAGGIQVKSDLVATPLANTAILAAGTLLASVLGTTGASMLLIRPLIAANHYRRCRNHLFVFFIFLVSNIGGSLSPLGDPPLFLGFLQGVSFFWTTSALLRPMLLSSGILLALFYAIDRYAWLRDRDLVDQAPSRPSDIRVHGAQNLLYLSLAVAVVCFTGMWPSSHYLRLGAHIEVPLAGMVRDVLLLGLTLLSWSTTPARIRIENAFSWYPIQEVAVLFAALFVTMVPAIAILRAGSGGALAPLIRIMSRDGQPIDTAYFWFSGLLSSFLDNAPTYLVFFNLAGGDAHRLMGQYGSTLAAISAGAVFMGANTYIGNAPNFMVRSICEERGIKMPSFLGYLWWSGLVLLPLFGLLTWIFFS